MAFKPDIDDLRESPAVHVADALLAQGNDVVAMESNIQSHDKFELLSLEAALETADVLGVLVNHREFLDVSVKRRIQDALRGVSRIVKPCFSSYLNPPEKNE